MAVQAFFVKHHGNAEPRIFQHPFLNGVGELGHRARAFLFARSGDLAHAILQHVSGFFRREVALVIHDERFHLPQRLRLRHLFFKRHALEQVGDALLDGQARVLVIRRLLLRKIGHVRPRPLPLLRVPPEIPLRLRPRAALRIGRGPVVEDPAVRRPGEPPVEVRPRPARRIGPVAGVSGHLIPDQAGEPRGAGPAARGVGDDDVVGGQRPAAVRPRGDRGDVAVPGAAVVRRADLDADHHMAQAGVQGRAQRPDGLREHAGGAPVQQAERLGVAGHRHRGHDLGSGRRKDLDAHPVRQGALGRGYRYDPVQHLLVHPYLFHAARSVHVKSATGQAGVTKVAPEVTSPHASPR